MKKKMAAVLAGMLLVASLSACGSRDNGNNVPSTRQETEDVAQAGTSESSDEPDAAQETESQPEQQVEESTETAADTDTFALEPAEPYSSEDLDWRDEDSRVSREHENEDGRNVELESTTVDHWESYDTVFIGYPNWWADLPMPVYTFLEEYDFGAKTIIPFVTHGGSGFSGTIETISELQPGAHVSGNTLSLSRNSVADSEEDVVSWAESLGLQAAEVTPER